jgi:hypothetical protein
MDVTATAAILKMGVKGCLERNALLRMTYYCNGLIFLIIVSGRGKGMYFYCGGVQYELVRED